MLAGCPRRLSAAWVPNSLSAAAAEARGKTSPVLSHRRQSLLGVASASLLLTCVITTPSPRGRSGTACSKARPAPVDSSRLGEIHVPVLCAAGMRDALYPGVKELAHQIPGARLEAFSGRGHIGTVNDPRFKKAVLAFLSEVAAGQETPTLAT